MSGTICLLTCRSRGDRVAATMRFPAGAEGRPAIRAVHAEGLAFAS
ncbi:hypothetical protein [Aureimonas endophytica]|nr:hypothetical protein [Aureimonas endophytica]